MSCKHPLSRIRHIDIEHLIVIRGWSFITFEGDRPFCWGVIFQLLIVLGGSFSDKEVLPGGHFMRSGIKKIFYCYNIISEEIDVRCNINCSES